MKKLFKLIPTIFLSLSLFANQAEWTFGAYMQGDNNLDPSLDFIISQMIAGCKMAYMDPDASVNIIAQVDFQEDKRTWRFRITAGGRIEDGSISTEMGMNPAQEIIDFTLFLKQNFDAKKFALMLYNHGSGIEDYKDDSVRGFDINKAENLILKSLDLKSLDLNNFKSFNFKKTEDLEKVDLKKENIESKEEVASEKNKEVTKGILYDDSQNTCLTNPAMKRAFLGIKDILGKKLDLLILDACLMSMLEVHYQIKDSVQYCVSSQQIKYSGSWNYTDVISMLIQNSSFFDGLAFGNFVVDFYQHNGFYKERTASCINLSSVKRLKNNLNNVSNQILECARYNRNGIVGAIRQARNLCVPFYNKDYIDLYNLYQTLKNQFEVLYEQDEDATITSCCGLIDNTAKYLQSLRDAIELLNAGLILFPQIVCSNAAGPDRQDAHGLSIYFPALEDSKIHRSYYDTDFAKDCNWIKVLKLFF